jgi:hypothetical protein
MIMRFSIEATERHFDQYWCSLLGVGGPNFVVVLQGGGQAVLRHLLLVWKYPPNASILTFNLVKTFKIIGKALSGPVTAPEQSKVGAHV